MLNKNNLKEYIMAVKKTEESAPEADVVKKNNSLVAVALGVAGAALLLSAGTAFANTNDHRPDARAGYSNAQEGMQSQGGQKGSQQGMDGQQSGQHRERGEKGPHQNGMMQGQDLQSDSSTTDVAPQSGMQGKMGQMKTNANSGAS